MTLAQTGLNPMTQYLSLVSINSCSLDPKVRSEDFVISRRVR